MPPKKKGLSGGAIAGIVIGVILGVILIAVLAYVLIFRKKTKQDPKVDPNSNAVELQNQGRHKFIWSFFFIFHYFLGEVVFNDLHCVTKLKFDHYNVRTAS